MSLTIVAINHAKPKDKTYRLYDEKGLYLEVTKHLARPATADRNFRNYETKIAFICC